MYAKAVLKFAKLNTVAQQREAVTRGRSLLPYRLRYITYLLLLSVNGCKKIISVSSVVKNKNVFLEILYGYNLVPCGTKKKKTKNQQIFCNLC
ncbi:MAG: hypothetical protein LBK06_06130 [Planctomycetaceae bacterium]|nr:hypothetical protein [Planctomycetaceae bacterium]